MKGCSLQRVNGHSIERRIAVASRSLLQVVIGSLLVVSILLGAFITTAHSAYGAGAKAADSSIYWGFSCCSSAEVDTVYHPGEFFNLNWMSTEVGTGPKTRFWVALKAEIIGPFSSVKSLKKSMTMLHPKTMPVEAKSKVLRVLNAYESNPLSIIKIPSNAGTGYYDLVFTSLENGVTSEGASVIRIHR